MPCASSLIRIRLQRPPLYYTIKVRGKQPAAPLVFFRAQMHRLKRETVTVRRGCAMRQSYLKNAALLTGSDVVLRLAGMGLRIWLANELGGEGMGQVSRASARMVWFV